MLSQVRMQQSRENSPVCAMPSIDNRWNRDMQEDMKAAIELLWKFKAGLDKLHPECLTMIENMLQIRNRY